MAHTASQTPSHAPACDGSATSSTNSRSGKQSDGAGNHTHRPTSDGLDQENDGRRTCGGASVIAPTTAAMIEATLDDHTRGPQFIDQVTATICEALDTHTSFITSSLTAAPGRSRLLACWTADHRGDLIEHASPQLDHPSSSAVVVRDLDSTRAGDRWLIDRGLISIVTITIPTRRRPDNTSLCTAHTDTLNLTDDELTALRLVALRLACELDEAEVVPCDVTETRSMRDQLLHTQTLESVKRLAGGVAHDFNNALHVIRGNISALQRDRPHDAENLDHRLAAIVRAVDRMSALVDRLTVIGRSPTNQPTRVLVDQFISDLAPELCELLGPEVTLRYELNAADCAVLIDRGRLEDVVSSLVRNAQEALELRGNITISSRRGADESVSIHVIDDGIGLDVETTRHIFEPFFSTKSPGVGVGLGLALSSATITDAGGTVTVHSVPGAGTTVTVELPCRHATTTDNRDSAASITDPLT